MRAVLLFNEGAFMHGGMGLCMYVRMYVYLRLHGCFSDGLPSRPDRGRMDGWMVDGT